MVSFKSHVCASLLFLAALVLAGCDDEPVVTYQAPKETLAASPAPAAAAGTPMAGAGAMTGMPVQTAEGVSLVWQAPASWRAESGHPMRKGSFAVGAADVAITAFPGDVGGILANVNRWRGQAGLAPIDDSALPQSTTAIDSQGLHFVVLDAQGGSAPIVAALLPWNGGTWFFKLTGPAAAVAAAKPAFLEFLHTVRAP